MAEMSGPRPRRSPESVAGSRCNTPGPGSRSATPRAGAPAHHAPPVGSIRCCCGQTDCIYLKHNCSVLESVENDVRTAAKLGQSLLERHELYMADAARERAELMSRIDQLEMDKKELEVQNAQTIQENRALLDQLEALNATVTDDDTHIKMLEVSLQSSQQTIRRLEGAAERAEDMERHIAALEAEQAALQNSLVATESEARSALNRWKRAERGIADLQFQLERMEKEARDEQERHREVLDRMERQRAVERELSTAAGRLKGAAAVKALQDPPAPGTESGDDNVNHLVRDLLQDNATLQVGIAELRDMLVTSNDEIQMLRDQLTFHQPADDSKPVVDKASTLHVELGSSAFPGSPEAAGKRTAIPATPEVGRHHVALSQEFHIHHHYHVVTPSGRKTEAKRPKKKRAGFSPSAVVPPAAVLSVPSTPASRSLLTLQQDGRDQRVLSADASPSPPPHHAHHVSRDSISTVMTGPSNRWSVFSDPPSDQPSAFSSPSPSSPPTDPKSYNDRPVFSDMSTPVSPTTSVDPFSPTWRTSTSRRPSAADGSVPSSLIQSSPIRHQSIPEADETHDGHTGNNDQKEADEPADESASSEVTVQTPTQPSSFPSYESLTTDQSDIIDEDEPFELPSRRRRRQQQRARAVSLASTVSISVQVVGSDSLDTHTLKTWSSQLTLRSPGTAMADTGLSSVTAQPVMISRARHDSIDSNTRLLDSLGGSMPRKGRAASSPVIPPMATAAAAAMAATGANSTAASAAPTSSTNRLGKLVAWRPWGSISQARPAAAATTTSPANAAAAVMTAASSAPPTVVTTTSAVAVVAASVPEDGDANMLSVETTTSPGTTQSSPALSAVRNMPEHTLRRTKSVQVSVAVQSINDLGSMRPPGINQAGAIPGFLEYWSSHQRRAVPSNVHAEIIDEEALRDGLLGD